MAVPPTGFYLRDEDPPSKREILRCALRLFVRDGLCETSVRDIAAASGYTNPALYKFFPSKEALALHLFEGCYLRIESALRESMRGRRFGDDLAALVGAYAGLVDGELEAVIFVSETLRQFWPRLPKAARRHSLLQDLRGLVARGVAERAVPPSADPDLIVAVLLGTMGQIARMAYFGEWRGSVSARSAELSRIFRRAVGGASA
jgi:TetR/AcrR family transcriptional regulator, repressor of fatR-cypB operon